MLRFVEVELCLLLFSSTFKSSTIIFSGVSYSLGWCTWYLSLSKCSWGRKRFSTFGGLLVVKTSLVGRAVFSEEVTTYIYLLLSLWANTRSVKISLYFLLLVLASHVVDPAVVTVVCVSYLLAVFSFKSSHVIAIDATVIPNNCIAILEGWNSGDRTL